MKQVVRDPIDDDTVLVESRAEMTPVPHEPSEFEKQKHNLTHIPFQPWCTSCVKGKAQSEPHKRTERIIEDSELPVIQCDYLMLKDVAGTSGLKVLSMYVRTFGYGMSTVVETKGPTDMFATMWAVKMLNSLTLSDIILQCAILNHRSSSGQKVSSPNDQNEQSFEVLPDGHIKAMEESKTIRNSCKDRSEQCWQQCKNTHTIQTIRRETALAHLLEVGKGSGNPATKVGRQMEIWRVAGKERPHGRTPCPNR